MDVSEASSRAAEHAAGDSSPHRADGDRESGLGLHAYPGGTKTSGVSRGTVNHRHHPQATRDSANRRAPDVVADVSTCALGAVVAADFFTTEVWTARGLVMYYTLLVIELHSRRVRIVRSTPNPNEAFMRQMVRAVTDDLTACAAIGES